MMIHHEKTPQADRAEAEVQAQEVGADSSGHCSAASLVTTPAMTTFNQTNRMTFPTTTTPATATDH